MLLLNEKETKIILNAMEFLETLGTPEATKQAELIDSVTYSQVNQDADIIDLLLGCFNELENKYSRYELIENECYNLLDEIRKEAEKEVKNDTGYHNIKLNALKKELENMENIIERLEYWKMKKIYINELETEKRNELIKKNSKLINKLQADLYDSNMEMQFIDSKNIMNDEALRSIEYHDNYNSFFYTLKDWRKFIINIDTMYLSEEARKTADIIYNKIDALDSMDPYSDNYYNLDEWLFKQTEKVLKDIEDYLHSYEEYPEEDEAIQYADEMDQLNDYYIEEREDGTSDNVIRLDIAYTECFIW